MLLSHTHQNEVYGKSEGESGLIRQVADMLCQGKSKDSIRAHCLASGQTEEQAYLTYMAASILAGDRVEARRAKVA